MRCGEIYRTRHEVRERGGKPECYLIVSRDFVAGNDDIDTVVCVPIYSRVLGISSEMVLGVDDGLARGSAARCDFLTLMFKKKLTHFVATLPVERIGELNRALAYALQLDAPTMRNK